MVRYIEDNVLLCHNQHGFRSGRSCLTQLLSHFDDVLLGLLQGHDTDSIYLDYAKAFDKVDHNLLLEKLKIYGFPQQLIDWISSFLKDRPQEVVVNGIKSFLVKIISGVPQGTVLGPILFILFINDMDLCVKHSKVRFFADDTRIMKEISCEDDTVYLQEDLNSILEWSLHNNMVLHEEKFDLIIHKAEPQSLLHELPHTIESFTYDTSSSNTLYPTEQLKDLGILISSDVSWSPHIGALVSRARSVSSWMLGVFKTRDRVSILTLYKSLVRSLLEYCCPLWNPSKIGDIQLLESVQRTLTSRVHGVQHMNYWDRLRSLKLMSLQRRRERYLILHMFKILHDLCPNDLNVKFAPLSRLGVRALIPNLSRASKQRHQTMYDSSFTVLGPRLWNTIPSELTQISSQQQFKNRLTNYLFSIPDKPPVQGYSCANNNSLLSWSENKAESQLLWWSPDVMAC